MYTFFLVLLLIDGIILSAVVLLQAGQGGGLAAMGGGMGTDNLIGGRQAATLLTRMSWITGGVFLALSLILSIVSSRNNAPRSILRDQFGQPAPATAPATNQPAALPGSQQPAGDPAAAPTNTAPATTPAPLPGTTTTNE